MLAATTSLYEFYYDAIKGGKFIWEMEKMHNQYGPIVRINPREIHVRDPYFFDQIYNSKRQDKDPYIARIFASPLSGSATVDHDHHRFRRELVNPFFSKRAVMGLEYIIRDKVDKVSLRLQQAYKDRTVVSLDGIFAALTADVISHYTYGESMGILDTEDMRNDFRDAVRGAVEICHFTRFSPLPQLLVDNVPWLIEWLQPISKGMFDAKRMLRRKTLAVMNDEDGGKDPNAPKTIFDSLCDKSVPAAERTLPRVMDEAFVVLGAGTETTARVLALGAFYLYQDRAMLDKMREELRKVMPEPSSKVSSAQLEQLPYLAAVVNESLRLSHSVIMRLPRIATATPLAYGDYTIPPGTPVSQSSYFVHTDTRIFPDAETFNPERWIEASNKGERLTKFLVPFSKGPRICLGMNLAYSELYQMFAVLFRCFEMKICNTPPESIRITRDLFIGLPDADTLQVQGVVTGVISH
ncbi:hypothetical protein FE257_001799 [Aspergillus nanangensis]|uniref:Cytochrome P450 n=1 Tax=Aspergillus nanangensis TaxID=2582783 RepID=A0AAD4GNP6_ASPNN|nr:hypothetical protein FE257_001799 [Aspergillus nanangensis]